MLLRLDRKAQAHGMEKREEAFYFRISPFREHAVEVQAWPCPTGPGSWLSLVRLEGLPAIL
jgi:hypothetical protein